MNKTRRFFYTWNNYNQADLERLTKELPEGFSYHVFQVEKGENGTPHIQGYAEFKEVMRWTTFQRKISPEHAKEIHAERVRSPAACIAYCKKEETRQEGPWELGEAKKGQEKKSSAAEVLDQVRQGEIRLADVDSETLLSNNFFSVAKHMRPTLTMGEREVRVITIVGSAGIGKSWCAQKIAGGDFCRAVATNGNVWFVGAENEPDTLILDEFTGQIPLSQLLQLLDKWPYSLSVKGAMYAAKYTQVIITTNVTPDKWYTGDTELTDKRLGNLECLYRRIGYGRWMHQDRPDAPIYIEIPTVDVHETRQIKRDIETQRKDLHDQLSLLGLSL